MIRGLIYWYRCFCTLKKSLSDYNRFEDNFFIIYPGEEHLVDYVLEFINAYATEKNTNKLVFFTSNNLVFQKIIDFKKYNVNILCSIRSEKSLAMLSNARIFKYYTDRLMVISTRYRYDSKLINLIGVNGIQEKDLVYAGLLNLKLTLPEVMKNDRI